MTLRLGKHELHGIIPPLVTPLVGIDELDNAALARIIEHVLSGGVQGLFALGTTGECASLSRTMRQQIVAETCAVVSGRGPVLVGITDTSLVDSLALANFAQDVGAAAVVAAPPYYYFASDEELTNYFEQVADRSPLPLILYNMPQNTKLPISLNALARLCEHENIVALKDSSGDILYLKEAIEVVSKVKHFPVFVGPEQLLSAALALGAAGGVNGGSHLAPHWFTDLYKAHRHGDAARVAMLQARIDQFGQTIYRVSSRPSRFIAGIKSALRAMGLCGDLVLPPLLPLSKLQHENVETYVKNLGLRESFVNKNDTT